MLTTTAGFRHDSISTARDVMGGLGGAGGFAVTATEDLSSISAASLSSYDVVFFALTSGELPLGTDQKFALTDFVARGGGFMGVHSATDSLYNWPEYGQLIGAYFKEHPWTTTASVIVEDQAHPTTTGLGASFSIREEFYTFRDNPRPSVAVLLRLDAASVNAAGDYPTGLGRFIWKRARVLQRIRPLPGDVAGRAISAADDGGRALDWTQVNCQRVALKGVIGTALVYAWAPFANLLWYLETIVMGTISLVLWPFDRSGELQHGCARLWNRMVAFTIGVRIRVHGTANVERGRRVRLYGESLQPHRHTGAFAYPPYQFKIMAKRSFSTCRSWAGICGHPAIFRSSAATRGGPPGAFARSSRRARRPFARCLSGRHAHIGWASCRNSSPGLSRSRCARACRFVPVDDPRTYALLPKTALAPRPGRVDVFIGTPIPTAGLDEKALPDLLLRTRDAIAEEPLKGSWLTAQADGELV